MLGDFKYVALKQIKDRVKKIRNQHLLNNVNIKKNSTPSVNLTLIVVMPLLKKHKTPPGNQFV